MKTVTAVAGILWRDETFLAVERPEGKVMAGYWEFPGGKIEKGETPGQALRRELAEELGITEVRPEFWKTITHVYAHGHIVLHLFHVRRFTGEPRALEKQAMQWVSPTKALSLKMLPADMPVVRELAGSSAKQESLQKRILPV